MTTTLHGEEDQRMFEQALKQLVRKRISEDIKDDEDLQREIEARGDFVRKEWEQEILTDIAEYIYRLYSEGRDDG